MLEKTSLRGGLNFDAGTTNNTPLPGGDGWVSDLLRRASRDETTETVPRQRSEEESLGSLSAEIAKSIEHSVAVSLWERYQRGENNVFTRDVYTQDGQRTFDEISGKYRSDDRFRQSVDRYITDFERLIADVSKNDSNNIMTQTYLTSDTGKVYTMLAHAAGRFG